MLVSPEALLYPLWAISIILLSLILVPRREYVFLLPHGLIGAYSAGLVIFLASRVIKAWEYIQTGPFEVAGAPVFILMAWGATMIVFLWAFPYKSPKWVWYLYIGLFAPAGGTIGHVFHQAGLRPYAPWFQSWMWMPVVFMVFWVNSLIYLKRIELETDST